MDLSFNVELAHRFNSPSQRAKALTEDWASREAYCPNCGKLGMVRLPNNNPVGDLLCPRCNEEYELKSLKHSFGPKVEDGAYKKMLERLGSSTNPSFFFLHYDPAILAVQNFFVIPKHFFVPDVIEARRPLSGSARRKHWEGCRILLHSIPESGRISLIRDRCIEPRHRVLTAWRRTLFLRDETDVRARGWLLNVMKCVERINRSTFTIEEVYAYEDELSQHYPANRYIKEKIRQQLQVLRDTGYLEFTGRGTYRMVTTDSHA
jgi:type II restriction enzyme